MKEHKLSNNLSFLDYLYAGCQIKAHFAIDYTNANAAIDSEDSLHHKKGGSTKSNGYSRLLTSLLTLFKDYHLGGSFPVYGYGAKIDNAPEDSGQSKCFAVNGNIYQPECQGINHAIGAYFNSL